MAIGFLAIIGLVWLFRGLHYEEIIHYGGSDPESPLRYKVSSMWGIFSETYDVRPIKRDGYTVYEYYDHKSKEWRDLPEP